MLEAPSEAPTVRVAGRSDVARTARAIARFVKDFGTVEVRVIGAPALNQAIKAVAIARDYFKDVDLVVRPSFGTTDDVVVPVGGVAEVSCLILVVSEAS